ncbi:MAG: YkgJ family cysteine cluster protein, partial [Thermodesulfovibrionales bacterium]|nr:YkgJ family cysteine cluster protein [Thermodesulfovibrionales bacterium]
MAIDRTKYKSDEENHSWLKILLDAYEAVDDGITKSLQDYEAKNQVRLACKKGCSNCCKTHQDIPVYPLELVGIYWYTIEKIDGDTRKTLKTQLGRYKGEARCPFLVDDLCAIYEVRPISCRQFNV